MAIDSVKQIVYSVSCNIIVRYSVDGGIKILNLRQGSKIKIESEHVF